MRKKHVDDSLLLEVKSVDTLNAVHQAQVLTYLKLSGIQHGLLINFNARLVKDGIKSRSCAAHPRTRRGQANARADNREARAL